jgi:hypothetical protein
MVSLVPYRILHVAIQSFQTEGVRWIGANRIVRRRSYS